MPSRGSQQRIPSRSPKVAVVGGGISGLAAAHRLVELNPAARVTLWETSCRLGGVLETSCREGFLIERSADSFVTKLPWAVNLCQRLGLADQLIPTDDSRRRALVVWRGKLQRLPAGFLLMAPQRLWPIITTPILSPWGKLRLLCEPLVPPSNLPPGGALADVSVASFARRRLGAQVYERIVQPLLAGIYTADSERLSMAATLPQFLEDIAQYGSLLRAARRRMAESTSAEGTRTDEESGARYGMFFTLRDGLSTMIAALAERLPSDAIRLNTPVCRIGRNEVGHWTVQTDDNSHRESYDAVALATPAASAAKMLQTHTPELAAELAAIQCAGSVVVSLCYRREQVRHALDGFGFVVPAVECRQILAASFSSMKFPGRAPPGNVLIRVFVGGALHPELTQLGAAALLDLAHQEVSELLSISGEPLLYDVARWPSSMPQYHVGHLARVERIERLTAAQPGLELAGNAYRGVGIPQCVLSGETAAERIDNYLRRPS